MPRIDSGMLLGGLGYEYYSFSEEGSEPERAGVCFSEAAPCMASARIGGERLYRHQLETLEALRDGYSVVLVAGTGSGKTEAWFLHVLHGGGPALAVYPTLALADDQLRRLEGYCGGCGCRVVAIDASRRASLVRRHGTAGARRLVAEADIVVTNPAFLLHQVKKYVESASKPLLAGILGRLGLLVIDELDFYSPRGIALLEAMVELVSLFRGGGLQVVVLAATLANPEELCRWLRGVTGRPCRVVKGRAFRVPNRVYVVLGKGVERVFEEARRLASKVEDRLDEDVKKALRSIEEFKRNMYRVLGYLEALGLPAPSPGLDPAEIISHYTSDDVVTLVFTRSINAAERLAARVKAVLGEEAAGLVATHHHLVPKEERRRIEEAARRGEVRVIISPRTLSQGIDIGLVGRIVHVGLPMDLREFLQREGRKGRRRELGYTETIIIPYSPWDRELLSKGVDALAKWLHLPLEKTLVNPENKYRLLFTGLAKLVSPWMRAELSREEASVLQEVGVLTPRGLDESRLKRLWFNMNFYEYGPPYGVKRYIETDQGQAPLEQIGWCDLVERFQPGCLDYAQDAVVVRVETSRGRRHAKAVVETPVRRALRMRISWLEEALEEYKYTKMSWGEKPSFLSDFARAKITSRVVALVYPPRRGFGLLRKIPNRVEWVVYSERPYLVETEKGHMVTYRRKVVVVPVETAGSYSDYTYGMVVEASERDDALLLRAGLAFIMLVLRRVFGVEFETIMYSVNVLGDKKEVELHEPESAGILYTIDWGAVRRAVEAYKPDELDPILLRVFDEIAYSWLLSRKMNWELARAGALRVIELLELLGRVRAAIAGRRVTIPKPSRSLRIVAVDLARVELGGESVVPEELIGVGFFDGEEAEAAASRYLRLPFARPPREVTQAEALVEDLVYYEGFRLLVYDREAFAREAAAAGLRRLERLAGEALDVASLLPRLGLPRNTPLEHLIEAVEYPDKPQVPSIAEVLSSRSVKRLEDMVKNYVSARAKATYIAALAASAAAGVKLAGGRS